MNVSGTGETTANLLQVSNTCQKVQILLAHIDSIDVENINLTAAFFKYIYVDISVVRENKLNAGIWLQFLHCHLLYIAMCFCGPRNSCYNRVEL